MNSKKITKKNLKGNKSMNNSNSAFKNKDTQENENHSLSYVSPMIIKNKNIVNESTRLLDTSILVKKIQDLPVVENDSAAFVLADKNADLKNESYIGGLPTRDDNYLVNNWPYFNNDPLPFLAQVIIDESETLYVFINDMNEAYESWSPENSSNVVLSSLNFENNISPDWITLKTNKNPESRLENTYLIVGKLDEPEWLQGDEAPEDSEFILQIPSTFNDAEEANFGLEGYGTIYIFKTSDNGRVLWQS